MSPIKLLNRKSREHQLWHHYNDVTAIFCKNKVIGGQNFTNEFF